SSLSMSRHIFPSLLLMLSLAVAGSSWVLPAAQEGAERLTIGANLLALHAWAAADTIIAQSEGGQSSYTALDIEAGTVETLDALPHSAPASLVVAVEGVTQRLQLGNRTLFTTDEEILGRPTLSPDGTWLAVARYPRGNVVAALGELWRFDLSGETWTRLTENGVEEGSPVISPDGWRIAFVREGDVWIIPSDRTTYETLMAPPGPGEPEARTPQDMLGDAPSGPVSHDPPDTIRVKHGAENNCRSVPVGQVDVLPFEEYVKRVVPHESPRSWPIETLKAQAVAVRSYAWRQIIEQQGLDYDVWDTTADQYMCDVTYSETNAAVDATSGQHLVYTGNNTPIFAQYSAENSSATGQGNYYLIAVDDPPGFGELRYGHGKGFSQWGGKRWAEANAEWPWSYRQILLHYYSEVRLEPPAGDPQTLLDVSNRPTGDYLRGSALWLELNASNVSVTRAREYWLLDPGGNWYTGPWRDDAQAADGWGHLFDLRALPDLPHDRYRVEANTLPESTPSDRPVLRLGIDRTPPALSAALALDPGSLGAPQSSATV
ncbi:MAG: SpoIID/LytB domain-containing protein, partial [Candidatus Binatia bacterium]